MQEQIATKKKERESANGKKGEVESEEEGK
jgi:hypothetical protein